MTLEDVYFLSQIVAAAALVASLVYVGWQLQLSQKMQRAAMHQARADRLTTMSSIISQPHVQAALGTALMAPASLTNSDRALLGLVSHLQVTHYTDVDWQFRAGFLEEEAASQNRIAIAGWFAIPAVRAQWQVANRNTLAPSLVEKIERELMVGRPLRIAPPDPQRFQDALAALLSGQS